MEEPLDEKVKKEIDEWRAEGKKGYEWIEENLDRLNQIYCNKETLIRNHTTTIILPIKEICLQKGYLMVRGERFEIGILGSGCSFDEKYTIIIKELSSPATASLKQKTLEIVFTAYK